MRAVGIGRSLSLIVLFGLGASGCSESTRQTEPSIVIDTLPGGAVRVTSQGEGDWSLDGAGWSLDPELRIGSLEGEHDAFARIEAVELLSDGRIVVLDRGAHTVTVFDSSGGHLSSFGGDGDGPGELRFPVSLNQGPAGNLWVGDVRADRFTVFTADGALLDTHRYPADEITGRGDFAADGRFRDLSFRRLLVLDEQFRPEDTILMPEFEGEVFRPASPASSPGSFSMVALRPVPFTARQVNALSPDGSLWVGVTDRYALARLGSDGDTVRIIRRAGVERHPVTAEERAAAVEDLSPLIEHGADLDLSRIPETKPYFSRFLFADDGHLWVQMETEAGFSGQRWDVFDPTGVHLGSVETELDLGTMVIRDGHVLGVVTDELDIQYVVRARIVPEGP